MKFYKEMLPGFPFHLGIKNRSDFQLFAKCNIECKRKKKRRRVRPTPKQIQTTSSTNHQLLPKRVLFENASEYTRILQRSWNSDNIDFFLFIDRTEIDMKLDVRMCSTYIRQQTNSAYKLQMYSQECFKSQAKKKIAHATHRIRRQVLYRNWVSVYAQWCYCFYPTSTKKKWAKSNLERSRKRNCLH